MSKHKYSKEFLDKTGLKLEEINPSKAEKEAEQEAEASYKAPNFTEKSIGLKRVRDGGGHKYSLVVISYDPETGATATPVEVVFETGSKEEATNQFKMKVDELNLFYYER